MNIITGSPFSRSFLASLKSLATFFSASPSHFDIIEAASIEMK